MVKATPRPLHPQERDPVPIVLEAGWNPGSVWMGVESFPPPGFDPRTVQPGEHQALASPAPPAVCRSVPGHGPAGTGGSLVCRVAVTSATLELVKLEPTAY